MMSHAAMPACGDYYCSDGCGSCDDCETPYLLEDSDCSDDEADQSLEPIDVDDILKRFRSDAAVRDRCCKWCPSRIQTFVKDNEHYKGDLIAFAADCRRPYLNAVANGCYSEFVFNCAREHYDQCSLVKSTKASSSKKKKKKKKNACKARASSFRVLGTVSVCSTAYFTLTGIPSSTFYRHLDSVARHRPMSNPVYQENRGGSQSELDQYNRRKIEIFILEFARSYGDSSLTPTDQDGVGLAEQLSGSEIHLDPIGFGEWHDDFVKWWDDSCIVGEPPTEYVFKTVFHEHFCRENKFNNPTIVLREVKRNHGACPMCAAARQLIRSGNPANRLAGEELRAWHRKDHGASRKKYESICSAVASTEHDNASLVIDGAERVKFGAPFVGGRGGIKGLDSKTKVAPFVEGVICHGSGQIHLTLTEPTVRGSADLNCTLMMEALKAEMVARQATKFETLYIQIDGAGNTWNVTTFAFASWMVERGIANTVYLNRMLVSHTHCDIDQLFATLDGLLYGVRRSSTANPAPDALTPTAVRCLIEDRLKHARNGEVVQVRGRRSTYAFHEWLRPTALSGHGHRRHNQDSVYFNIYSKAADVHCCEVSIAGPASVHFDAARPRKAVVRFRSRMYGDAPFLPEEGIVMLRHFPEGKPNVAELAGRTELEALQAQAHACSRWASSRDQLVNGRRGTVKLEWDEWTQDVLAPALMGVLPPPPFEWSHLLDLEADDREFARLPPCRGARRAGVGSRSGAPPVLTLPDPQFGAVEVQVRRAQDSDLGPGRRTKRRRAGDTGFCASRTTVKAGDMVIVRAGDLGPGKGKKNRVWFARVSNPAIQGVRRSRSFPIGKHWKHTDGTVNVVLWCPIDWRADQGARPNRPLLFDALYSTELGYNVCGNDIVELDFGSLPSHPGGTRTRMVTQAAATAFESAWIDVTGDVLTYE